MKDWLSIDKPAIEETVKTALITIRVTETEKANLKKAAQLERISLSQFLVRPALQKMEEIANVL